MYLSHYNQLIISPAIPHPRAGFPRGVSVWGKSKARGSTFGRPAGSFHLRTNPHFYSFHMLTIRPTTNVIAPQLPYQQYSGFILHHMNGALVGLDRDRQRCPPHPRGCTPRDDITHHPAPHGLGTQDDHLRLCLRL
jgi:hypothetical protein